MDAEQIRRLEPQLAEYLKRFEDCFARRDTRAGSHSGQVQLTGIKDVCLARARAAPRGYPPAVKREHVFFVVYNSARCASAERHSAQSIRSSSERLLSRTNSVVTRAACPTRLADTCNRPFSR